MMLIYAYSALQRLFAMLVKPIYKNTLLHRASALGFFCTLFIIISTRGRPYRHALFSSFRLSLDAELLYFIANLNKFGKYVFETKYR